VRSLGGRGAASGDAVMRAFLVVILLLLTQAPSHAEPFSAASSLDQRVIADVTAAALVFMLPRTLDETTAEELSLWGLRGLTTIDPRLVVDHTATLLRLSLSGRLIYSRLAPPRGSAQAAWGEAIAGVAHAAWDVSDAVRRAGTQGILRSFFEDLFNHLDPYSRYATPAEAAADATRRNGRAGLGIELAEIQAGFVIRAVAAGSPAAAAGLRPGLLLLAVDGQALEGADIAAARALLAGPEGTEVRLTLRQQGRQVARGLRDVSMTRTLVTAPTVFAQVQGNLLVLRVTAFVHNTATALSAELARYLMATGPRAASIHGIVLDLRGNRGGLLRQAVAAAEQLAPAGVLAQTAGRDPASNQVFQARGVDLGRALPIVVIVDGRSASAAEVLAAALADRRRAVVVGSATLGKGLVQTIAPLPDGGALSLTWSRVLAPGGWPLQALGVLPQVCTSLGEQTLRHQLADLAGGRQPMERALMRHRSARAPVPAAEILEIRNACPAAEGRDSDMMAARLLIEQPHIYAAALIP